MRKNPDIDRLSLEARIKGLESIPPLPKPPLPGVPFEFVNPFLFDPKIVDTCKDNAATHIGTGWIVKINVPSFLDLQIVYPVPSSRRYPNGIKLAAFSPTVGSAIFSRASWICRLEGSFSTNEFNAGPLFRLPFDVGELHTQLFNAGPAGYSFLNITLLAAASCYTIEKQSSGYLNPRVWTNEFYVYMRVFRNNPNEIFLWLSSPGSGPNYGIGSAISFGISSSLFRMFINNQRTVPPAESIGRGKTSYHLQAYTTTDLATNPLPEELKPLYPTSWSV